MVGVANRYRRDRRESAREPVLVQRIRAGEGTDPAPVDDWWFASQSSQLLGMANAGAGSVTGSLERSHGSPMPKMPLNWLTLSLHLQHRYRA
jgi:hypothetical protein